jgi:Ser/Thr protein kinase RdoA (MazF antagonist)
LAVIGCYWLLLAVIGCYWLLLVAIGCYWLLLAIIDGTIYYLFYKTGMLMKDYNDLSYSGQIKRLKKLAEIALLNYSFEYFSLQCLGHGENTTFKILVFSSQSNLILKQPDYYYILRIYRPNKQDLSSINSELTWLNWLRQKANLAVPETIPAKNANLAVSAELASIPEPRYCAIFRWLPGKFLGAALNTKAIKLVGTFLANLHIHSRQFTPPNNFTRPYFDEDGLFGSPPFSLFPETKSLVSQNNLLILDKAAKIIREKLKILDKKPKSFGLIHGDLNFSNCKFYQGKIQVFDFDDCGWGYYIYDLAVTLYYLRNREDVLNLRQALLESYQQTRSLSTEELSCIDALIAARRLQLLRDLLQRQDNPKLRELIPDYVEKSVELMKKFIDN